VVFDWRAAAIKTDSFPRFLRALSAVAGINLEVPRRA